jgi:hypothetical protein
MLFLLGLRRQRFRTRDVLSLLGVIMSVMSRKKKNTDLERQKKIQREKDLKKKQMRNQLPAKQGKR